MRRIGNATSNRSYNARNVKPAIPMDVDEVDGVMERYIRQKYETKSLTNTVPTVHRTGSSSSEERPQLPPKPSKRFTFGLRSTSSTFPASRQERRPERSPPVSPRVDGFSASRKNTSPTGRSKPAKIFGADIGGSRQDNYELKLIALREMGFPDDKRNLTILKGENGNVDRAVATLIRLGECSRASSGRSSPIPEAPPKDPQPASTNRPAAKSTSPFDALDLNEKALPPPPVEEQNNSYNPFLQPSKPIEQSFQSLQLAPPSQLFPNATGGYSMNQPHINTNPFLQTYTPPPHPMAGNMGPFAAPPSFSQQPDASPNPFLRPSHSQTFPSANPFGHNPFSASTSPSPAAYNPTGQYPQPPMQMSMSPSHSFPAPQQALSNPFQQPAPLQTMMPQSNFASTLTQSPVSGPFQQHSPINGQFQQQPFQQQAFQQQTFQQQTFQQTQPQHYDSPFSQQGAYPAQSAAAAPRIDKASILALYSTTPQGGTPTAEPQASPFFQKRSATAPLSGRGAAAAAAGGLSPIPQAAVAPSPSYAPAAIAPSTAGAAATYAPSPGAAAGLAGPRPNHESVDFTALMAGRHSPDMFSGLSARIVTR
jgi:hypothetical protein